MTVKADLERAVAMAEAARGNYLLFATESEDRTATKVFGEMAEDMERHVKILESRRDYLSQHNKLNAAGDGEEDQAVGKQAQDGKKAQPGNHKEAES